MAAGTYSLIHLAGPIDGAKLFDLTVLRGPHILCSKPVCTKRSMGWGRKGRSTSSRRQLTRKADLHAVDHGVVFRSTFRSRDRVHNVFGTRSRLPKRR